MPPLPSPGYTFPAGSSRTTPALLHSSAQNTTVCNAGCQAPACCHSNHRPIRWHHTCLALQSSSHVAVRAARRASACSRRYTKSTACSAAAAAEGTATVTSVGYSSLLQDMQQQVVQLTLLHGAQLHSSQEFQDVIEHNPGSLIVLMCKAQGCRPCKMFSRKFQRLAEQFQDAIFLDIMGDETSDTRVSQAVLVEKQCIGPY